MENFELLGNYAAFHLPASASLAQAAELIKSSIVFARELQVERLLIDATHFTDMLPSVGERYFFVREWAEVANGKVKIAIVARPELIDPQRFVISVAATARLNINVFTSQTEAIDWLLKLQ